MAGCLSKSVKPQLSWNEHCLFDWSAVKWTVKLKKEMWERQRKRDRGEYKAQPIKLLPICNINQFNFWSVELNERFFTKNVKWTVKSDKSYRNSEAGVNIKHRWSNCSPSDVTWILNSQK